MVKGRVSYVNAILNNQALLEKQQQLDKNFFANWDKRARETSSMGPDYDYGLAKGLASDSRGHLGDIGKLPNHPTYSDQSAYAKLGMGAPGTWEGNTYIVSDKLNGEGLANKLAKLKWMQDNGHSDGDIYSFNGKVVK